MNNELQQLKDIHLPPPISLWPMAPGWIALCLFILLTIMYTIFYWYRRYQKKYTVKFALKKLDQLKPLMIENPDQINIAAEISTLLRRTALYYFHRDKVAGITGQQWLAFLNESGHTDQFTQQIGNLLTDAPYRKESSEDIEPLFNLARNWLTTIGKKNVIVMEK